MLRLPGMAPRGVARRGNAYPTTAQRCASEKVIATNRASARPCNVGLGGATLCFATPTVPQRRCSWARGERMDAVAMRGNPRRGRAKRSSVRPCSAQRRMERGRTTETVAPMPGRAVRGAPRQRHAYPTIAQRFAGQGREDGCPRAALPGNAARGRATQRTAYHSAETRGMIQLRRCHSRCCPRGTVV